MSKLPVACVQFTAGLQWSDHAEEVARLVRMAAGTGAKFIATPENTGGMVKNREELKEQAPTVDTHPAVPAFSELARETGAWLLCGSVAVRPSAAASRPVNRSLLFAPDGSIAAHYDKIHLFDVDLPGGESHRESALFDSGDSAKLADIGGVKLGLTICYDLRFASLFRSLAQAGAEIITVPSAFTVPTGEAHWEVLLRARAIETGAFILAPAQTGLHPNGRRTWGHSLIIDPWGRVLADAGDKPGVAVAVIELNRVREVRQVLPQLEHDKPFSPPASPTSGN
jgi:predicted amidohydrolase